MSSSILFACANGTNYSPLAAYLEARGHHVQVATSLSIFKEMVADAKPDLTVFDVDLLPPPFTASIKELTKSHPSLSVLFTLNQPPGFNEGELAQLKDLGVLTTPLTKELITTLLADEPEGSRASAPARRRRKPRRVRFSVQTKITAPYFLLSLILALGAAYLSTKVIFDTTRERFTNQLIETRKLASVWISQEEDVLLEALRLYAHTRGVAEGIRDGASDDLRDWLFPLALNDGIEAVEVLDLEGVSVLSMRHIPGGRIEEYEFSQGGSQCASWPIVKQVLEGISDASGDKYSSIVQASWGDYLYVSGPVIDEHGALAGAILVGESLTTITQEIRLSTTGQISIYDLDGGLLNSTLMVAPGAIDGQKVSSVLQGQDIESFTRVHRVSDIVYEELLGPLELRDGADAAVLGAALPQSFLVVANAVTRAQVFSLAALGFLLVILLGFAISRTFTRPLHKLMQATSRVAEGNLAVQVKVDSDDEIASLAESFNSMISSIKESKVKLVEAHNEVLNAYDLTIMGWAKALELRDKETEGHCQRVTEMTLRLAQAMGVDDAELKDMRRGALLHDIGKLGIPDSILLKPGPLNDEEWEVMRMHPVYSHDMLKSIDYLQSAIDIPYSHHEKWDGTGYPLGLKGEEIPLSARMFAIVDVWDALSSDRPYRKAWSQDRILDYLRSSAGSHFDPEVVKAFLEILQTLPGRGRDPEDYATTVLWQAQDVAEVPGRHASKAARSSSEPAKQASSVDLETPDLDDLLKRIGKR
jgi:putative nucleotidyltransferase with HDIG domain